MFLETQEAAEYPGDVGEVLKNGEWLRFLCSLGLAPKPYPSLTHTSGWDRENGKGSEGGWVALRALAKSLQSCPTLHNPIDCSPPGSSVHGISQARILEWVAISLCRGSSQPKDWTRVSCSAGRFFTELQGKPKTVINLIKKPFKITIKPMPKYGPPSQLSIFKKLQPTTILKK